ncbi:nucleotide pyrophosphatase/phosphodiesterase-like [Panicum miliaceum]|uniref:Nucleotide pyrophosphatase/phosphodiesterase-like n=1 Tax=Panicum miliaceum TaxID=4540 RepID=A0A3L6PU00_PANMI|nr:nucleotide pyrophosphatase/phosphodiesterase-like [Panicum miliaceum]
MTSEKSRYSGTMNGTIFVVAGGCSSHVSDYATAIPTWSIFRDQNYGFVKLTAFNHSSLLFEYKRSSDGRVYDSFTVDLDYRDVLSCVHDHLLSNNYY